MKGTKQSLNLTDYAWYILRCDYSAFTGENSLSKNISAAFLCDIFLKYFRDAQASVGIRLSERAAEIRRMGLSRTDREFRDAFIRAESERIIGDTLGRFEQLTAQRSVPRTIYVPDSVRSTICECALGSEGYYYRTYREPSGHYMKYLRAVLEEYARLPYCQREAVYCSDILNRLRYAMRSHCAVSFMYGSESVYGYPYAIESDEWSSYNYLLLTDEEHRVKHYRVCRLRSVSCIENDTQQLSDDMHSVIREEQINPVGIQFAGEPTVECEVMLTENGMNMYNRMVFLRPQYSSVEEQTTGRLKYKCTFCCSENQIKYYFFKFGNDAKVVSPQSLSNYFRKKYIAACRLYSE